MLCAHGCGESACYWSQAGKGRCRPGKASCPVVRAKNSARLKELHASGQKKYTHNPKSAWARGRTKETDPRIAAISLKVSETAERKAEENGTTIALFKNYRSRCQWHRRVFEDLYRVPGHELLKELGMYHRVTNPNGVVRDHRLSIRDGFNGSVDVELMKHPANCRFLTQKDNARKSGKSEITVDELICLVHTW